ncbi:hypothetical protein WAI453_010511 [Rhynchosporium graminicola]|uniref:Uncharacterized protein n=1 Tax=Rhynchosporium graminicola TaxID=2792576 RepID=A0A1E1JSV5_9HELO|nr:uncharacterized protein RCO7_04590 [Rhynchosporium commune]
MAVASSSLVATAFSPRSKVNPSSHGWENRWTLYLISEITPDPQDLVAQAAESRRNRRLGICVIENILAEFLEVKGTEWSVDHKFFLGNASNPNKADLWNKDD